MRYWLVRRSAGNNLQKQNHVHQPTAAAIAHSKQHAASSYNEAGLITMHATLCMLLRTHARTSSNNLRTPLPLITIIIPFPDIIQSPWLSDGSSPHPSIYSRSQPAGSSDPCACELKYRPD